MSTHVVYDPPTAATGRAPQEQHPSWLVMYGAWSPFLWALSRFATVDRKSIVIAAPEPGNWPSA